MFLTSRLMEGHHDTIMSHHRDHINRTSPLPLCPRARYHDNLMKTSVTSTATRHHPL